MRIIEEMVEYFSELLTEEQKAAVEKLFSIPSPEDDDYDEYYEDYEDDSGYDDEDFLLDFDPYDQDVLFPPQGRGKGHSRGKKRKWAHPVITAEGLVALFRQDAEVQWERVPVSLELFPALAGVHDPNFLSGGKPTNWQRFIAAVNCLKDLDEETLAARISLLLLEQKEKNGPENNLFAFWFHSRRYGGFTALADSFCRRRVEGGAGRAVLRALRVISYPENETAVDTHVYRSFLENRDLVGIFSYYRILRKLEYLLETAADEALRRAMHKYRGS
ncbi:MAG: hypothetical protein E7055_20815 [Lentisphaerae bacterium]|nr:hypothetical protein [Lentisphaerota bacterium]